MRSKQVAHLLRCLLAIGLLIPAVPRAQNPAETDFSYTKHLSHQFPDSAFLLLKEMYSKALEKKDQLATANCLQQMGQVEGYHCTKYQKNNGAFCAALCSIPEQVRKTYGFIFREGDQGH